METRQTNNWLEKTEIELLAWVHNYASNGLRFNKTKEAKHWLLEHKLSYETTMVCFNSGQLHHRRDQEFKDAFERIGFLKRTYVQTNASQTAYHLFGSYSMMFPLRNQENQIVNFCSLSMYNKATIYFNQKGIYPAYPHKNTKKLLVVDGILDAATILEARVLDNKEAVMALHEGKLLPEHQRAIQQLRDLQEVLYLDKPASPTAEEKMQPPAQ